MKLASKYFKAKFEPNLINIMSLQSIKFHIMTLCLWSIKFHILIITINVNIESCHPTSMA
jgi:hypothetical protein